jgi:dihydrodipicolinate reductase
VVFTLHPTTEQKLNLVLNGSRLLFVNSAHVSFTNGTGKKKPPGIELSIAAGRLGGVVEIEVAALPRKGKEIRISHAASSRSMP